MLKIEKEIWKDVQGFEGRYKISSHGRVISIIREKEKLLNPQRPTNGGYLNIALWHTKIGVTNKVVLIHQLVAEHFCEKPITNERLEVDHRDSNKLNNYYQNLRWLTHYQHKLVSVEKGEMSKGEEHWNNKLTKEQVLRIRSIYKPWVFSRQKVAKLFGVSASAIQEIIERKTWRHI